MKTKTHLLIFFILLSESAWGQRDDYNNFSVRIKFEKDIPVTDVEVFYTNHRLTGFNDFANISYKVNIDTNEIELYGTNIWIAGNHSYFPVIIFIHSEMKEYYKNSYVNEKEQRLTHTLYYLINENYSFEKEFNKEITFRGFDRHSSCYIEINSKNEVNYVYEAPSNLFLNPIVKIN